MRRAILTALILVFLVSASAMAQELPTIKNGALTIPWSDFKELLEKLQPPAVEEIPPPVDYTLGRGSLDGSLARGEFILTASYPLSILKRGWAVVPLVYPQAPLADIRIDGKTAPVTEHKSRLTLVLAGPATHTLTMRFRLAASTRPGPGRLNLRLPQAAGQVLTLKTGDIYSGVTVDGATMSRSKAGATMAIMTGDNLRLHYTVAMEQKEDVREKLPPKVLVENSTLVSIDEGFIRAVVQLNYEVRHAPVSEFKLTIPAGFEVADCSGASLVGWKVDEQSRLLTATIGFEVKGSYNLTLVLERSTKDASFNFPLPAIRAEGVERERGFFAVQVTGGVEVTPAGEVQGLQMVDAKELPSGLRSGSTNPIVLSFKYLQHPFAADLQVVRHKTTPVLGAAIDSANYVVQLTEDGDCVARAVYTVRNNRKQFLEITLPESDKIALWSTFVSDKPVKPSRTKDGKILLPLEKSSMTGNDLKSFNVEVIYYFNLGKRIRGLGSLNLVMPEVDLPISRSMLTVFVPERYRFSRIGGSLQTMAPHVRRSVLEGLLGSDEIVTESMETVKKAQPLSAMKPPPLTAGMRQGEAENVFQRKIRSAQQAVDATGSLPARFSVPKQGRKLRFRELITIGESSTVRLFFASGKLSSLLNYLILIIVALMVWHARRLVRREDGGRKWLIGGLAIMVALIAAGVSIGYAIGGAIAALVLRFVVWVVRMIRTHS